MKRNTVLAAIVGSLVLIVLGSCQLGMDPLRSPTLALGSRSVTLPSGAILVSATLHVYAFTVPPEAALPRIIDVHRINVAWQEDTVTWNSFHADGVLGYDPDTLGSLTVTEPGWYQVDIEPMISAWLRGTWPNYGVLLREDSASNAVWFASSQSEYPTLRPFVTLTYLSPDIGEVILTIPNNLEPAPLPDAYIWNHPSYMDYNSGYSPWLYAGLMADCEKESLVGVDLIQAPPPPPSTPPRTIGYWKNHAGLKSQGDMINELLPVWLGTPGESSNALQVTTTSQAVSILRMKDWGGPSNGVTKLYAQLLAAKLNLASGAPPGSLMNVITAADAFLAGHDGNDWIDLSGEDQSKVLGWMTWLDAYNNNMIRP